MKKLILSVTMSAGFSLAGFAQGVITFDSSGAPNGLVSIQAVLDTTTDINAELLTSTSASGTFTPVVELLLSSSNSSPDGNPGFDSSDIVSAAGDIRFLRNGHIIDLSGSLYVLNAAPGTTQYFEVEGWTGYYSSFDQAFFDDAFTAVTPVFSEVLGTENAPVPASLDNMPALYLFCPMPEPATYALATGGVSLASMLFFRRRKS